MNFCCTKPSSVTMLCHAAQLEPEREIIWKQTSKGQMRDSVGFFISVSEHDGGQIMRHQIFEHVHCLLAIKLPKCI